MDLSKTETITCPLCKNQAYQLKHTINGWKIVECCQCKFVYVNPRLQKQELLKIYTANYFDNKEVGYYHYTENKSLRKRNFTKWIQDALPFIKPLPLFKAMDIGCATGYCLEVFKEHNWKPYGIELDKAIALELSEKGYTIFDNPLIELKTQEQFNLISLFDVIEHLTDLPTNLSILHSLLAEDGIVVVVTPDYESWQRKFFGKKWFQFKPIEHVNYFSNKTLGQLAISHGFDIVITRKSGQFCDIPFLENRLKKYKFNFALKTFHWLTTTFKLKAKHLYVDTASLYMILRKRNLTK